MPLQEADNILSLLKALQQDMAEICDRIIALELNDRHMTYIEQHLDPPANTEPIIPQVSSQPAAPTSQKPLNPFPLSSPTPNMVSFSTQTRDEIQAINAKHSAIKNKLDMLANSINDFIRSITSSSSFTNSASAAGSK
ncbi:hypothetical protein RCL_jg7246.t1 [Rhizophagus clarus]|uniref:Uncharacterized protein n=1 Tax=Rhizophagus clarus TaxID=94130 RepID=A0A8H3QYZ9_9GLOM|nr:hypothetical protein RCL_jg7246.t1 [Rhizophagus clarus]